MQLDWEQCGSFRHPGCNAKHAATDWLHALLPALQLVLHNPLALNLLGAASGPGAEAGAGAAGAAGGAAAEIEHFRLDMPAACGTGGPAAEVAEKLLHLLALLKLNLVQRKVREHWGRGWLACQQPAWRVHARMHAACMPQRSALALPLYNPTCLTLPTRCLSSPRSWCS